MSIGYENWIIRYKLRPNPSNSANGVELELYTVKDWIAKSNNNRLE